MGGAGGGVIMMPQELVMVLLPDSPEESTTWAVKFKLPASCGTPEMRPVVKSSDRPAGSEPEVMENVYGGTPPLAWRLEL